MIYIVKITNVKLFFLPEDQNLLGLQVCFSKLDKKDYFVKRKVGIEIWKSYCYMLTNGFEHLNLKNGTSTIQFGE
jgi:hypothetical protein